MGKHSMPKPSWWRRLFFRTWEVTSDRYTDVDRFRTHRAATVFANEMNNPSLYEPGDYEGAVHKVSRRSFDKEEYSNVY